MLFVILATAVSARHFPRGYRGYAAGSGMVTDAAHFDDFGEGSAHHYDAAATTGEEYYYDTAATAGEEYYYDSGMGSGFDTAATTDEYFYDSGMGSDHHYDTAATEGEFYSDATLDDYYYQDSAGTGSGFYPDSTTGDYHHEDPSNMPEPLVHEPLVCGSDEWMSWDHCESVDYCAKHCDHKTEDYVWDGCRSTCEPTMCPAKNEWRTTDWCTKEEFCHKECDWMTEDSVWDGCRSHCEPKLCPMPEWRATDYCTGEEYCAGGCDHDNEWSFWDECREKCMPNPVCGPDEQLTHGETDMMSQWGYPVWGNICVPGCPEGEMLRYNSKTWKEECLPAFYKEDGSLCHKWDILHDWCNQTDIGCKPTCDWNTQVEWWKDCGHVECLERIACPEGEISHISEWKTGGQSCGMDYGKPNGTRGYKLNKKRHQVHRNGFKLRNRLSGRNQRKQKGFSWRKNNGMY